MTTQTIALADIISNGNVRVETGDVSTLAASINRHGLLQPLLVVPTSPDADNTTFTLVAGHRRHAALLEVGYEYTDAVVNTELTSADHVIAAQWAENTERKGLSAFEQTQVAWDLKLEGNKQAEVATLMGLTKEQVSTLHKTHKALSSDDLDPLRATQLTGAALMQIAEGIAPERIPDVIRLIVDGEARDVVDANRQVAAEYEAIEFMDGIAEDQAHWAELGINVVTTRPTGTGEMTDEYGTEREVHDNTNRKELRSLGFKPEDHIEEPCHVIWIDTNGYRPDVSHWCVDVSRHRAPTKAKGEPLGKVSPTLKREAKVKVEASSERRDKRDAKKVRVLKAGIWMEQRSKAADRERWFLDQALKNWGHDHTRNALLVLDLIGTRPKGAEYSWYTDTFATWCFEQFGDDVLKKDRWKAQFLVASDYIIKTYGLNADVEAMLDAVEVPAEPDVEA